MTPISVSQAKPPLVLALNPSIDAEWRVEQVRWEEKNNVISERRWAGGKGVNVARWLKGMGGHPRLLLLLGGQSGNELKSYLRAENIRARTLPLAEPTRVNFIITTARQGQLRFNPMGPRLSAGEWARAVEAVERAIPSAGLLVLSGSLPRGAPVSAYARLIRIARRHEVRTLLDCDGPALHSAVAARPFLVKPNEHELAHWYGRKLESEDVVTEAARRMSSETGNWVLLSRGAQGALLVNAGLKFFLSAEAFPVKKVRNTVGAGDAMLAAAAFQIGRKESPEQWLRSGLAAGRAATQCLAGFIPRNWPRLGRLGSPFR